MLIRRERPGDVVAIRAVTEAAFAQGDEVAPEGALVGELRASDAWLPALSLVAIASDGSLMGHVVATRGYLDSVPALGLAPLSVRPDRQRRGVGSALMHAVLGAADALDEPLVALLGDPSYYQRFGFRLSVEHGISPPVPEWRPHFQVRFLTAYHPELRGMFTYAEPFQRL